MELMAAASASEASPSAYQCAYEVFLSFRNIDTGKSFTDHLYGRLVKSGIQTYRDDNEVVRGENVRTDSQTAIALSKVAIIVLSKSYASSLWCLDELAMIVERKSVGLIVIPVFYNVCPSEVIAQSGSYTEAFAAHMDKFGEDRVRHWRAALRGVADLSGMVLEHWHEAQFIYGIMKEAANRLNRKSLHKLQPATNIDIEMINKSTMLNLETFGNDEVEMACSLTRTSRTSPPQVLHEFGIFSFFLSRSNIPDWYSYQEDGSSISFHVPVSMIGLNFWAVYTLDDPVINYTGNSDKFDFPVIRIENTTQNLDWTYTATFFEIPSVYKDKRWFSHLSFGNQFEVGDEVRISVKSYWYRVEKFGIHFAYEQQMDGSPSITTSSWYRMLADADVSQYQFQPGHFFLWVEESRSTEILWDFLLRLSSFVQATSVCQFHFDF